MILKIALAAALTSATAAAAGKEHKHHNEKAGLVSPVQIMPRPLLYLIARTVCMNLNYIFLLFSGSVFLLLISAFFFRLFLLQPAFGKDTAWPQPYCITTVY